jgi:hypothetical protein
MDLDHLWDSLFGPPQSTDLQDGINDVGNLSPGMTTSAIEVASLSENEMEFMLLWFGLWGLDSSPAAHNQPADWRRLKLRDVKAEEAPPPERCASAGAAVLKVLEHIRAGFHQIRRFVTMVIKCGPGG